jgi:hypothetical protein
LGATVLASEEASGLMDPEAPMRDESLGHIAEEEGEGDEGEEEGGGMGKAKMPSMQLLKRSVTLRFQQHS